MVFWTKMLNVDDIGATKHTGLDHRDNSLVHVPLHPLMHFRKVKRALVNVEHGMSKRVEFAVTEHTAIAALGPGIAG